MPLHWSGNMELVNAAAACCKSNLRNIARRPAISRHQRAQRYDSFLYQPSKHDFRMPKGRSHRFASTGAVLTAFVTIELAEEVKERSKTAIDVTKD